jgi:hypothetical protein
MDPRRRTRSKKLGERRRWKKEGGWKLQATVRSHHLGGQSAPIDWRSGTVQGSPLSPALFNICIEPFLRFMEQEAFKKLCFPIIVESGAEIRIDTAAYADDLILFAESGDGMRTFLDILAKFCNYTGMKINVKKCVALADLWKGDRVVKLDAPFVYRKYEGQDPFGHIDQWGADGEIRTETSSLYLGTTIAFNKEDEAKHGKHIIESIQENIEAIGRSRLNLTQKLHAIKTFELPRIDFRMMNGDIFQSDLREFDSWLRGQIMRWLKIQGIATEVFLMSWRDGGFTLPSLEERQYTMVIRTLLDIMATTDTDLLNIMRQFEKEEAERYGCTVVDRKEDEGGFMRWDGRLPDVRTHMLGPIDDEFHTPHPGEKKLPKLLKDDLSIFPRALRACQELGLSIWMSNTSPLLKHKDLGIDFTSSKISRNQETWDRFYVLG